MDTASLDAYWMGTPKGGNALGNKVLCLCSKRDTTELEVGHCTIHGVPYLSGCGKCPTHNALRGMPDNALRGVPETYNAYVHAID